MYIILVYKIVVVYLYNKTIEIMKVMKTVKVTIEDLRSYVSKKMSRCEFSDKELSVCLDLSIRRGNETRGSILKDALDFLYC